MLQPTRAKTLTIALVFASRRSAARRPTTRRTAPESAANRAEAAATRSEEAAKRVEAAAARLERLVEKLEQGDRGKEDRHAQ
jgi:hypothetical protein